MIALPQWSYTKRLIGSPWIIAPLALLYTVLVAPSFVGLLPDLANPQLPVLMKLFATPEGTTVAWIHIICFDLWVGRWIYLDSEKVQMPSWIRRIALLSVLMAGPFGAGLYLVIRHFSRKQHA